MSSGPGLRVYQPITHLLSAADADALNKWVIESLQKGAQTLLLDLKNVLFMDSRGLAVLVMAHKQVTQMGGVLVLCSAQEQVLMVLRLSNLIRFFPLYESVEDYRKAIANR